MKSAYKFLLAAFAATVALASCTKDIAADRQDTDPQDGLRKIAISFGTPTKTVLGDGLTPTFTEGDEMYVSDESGEFKRVQVELYKNSKGGTEAYFRTSLKGSLYAVYPASAAIFDEDGKLSKEKFNISQEQTGLFEDANIAVGISTDEENQMKFNNASAILKFYVGPEVGVNRLLITAQDTLDNTDWELTKSGSISVNLSQGSKFRKILGNEGRVCYVAVPSISSTVIMIVDSYTDAQTSSPDIPVTRVFRGNTVGVNQMVNVFIPYYITVNDQKWAYCNVGAFLPEESGYYFSWGNCNGCYYDTDKWIANDFTPEIYSKSSGNGLAGDIPATEGYDAARYAWGEGWRMPTADEVETFAKYPNMKTVWYDGVNTNYYGSRGLHVIIYNIYNAEQNLFFPFGGYGDGVNLQISGGDEGFYWTSSYSDNRFVLKYTGPTTPPVIAAAASELRYLGYLIRPIYDSQGGSDDPDDPDDPVGPDDSDEGVTFSDLKEYSENI